MSENREVGSTPPLELINWDIAQGPEVIPGTNWWNLNTTPTFANQQSVLGESPGTASRIALCKVRELHLEGVALTNGLQYVIVKDNKGNEVFDNTEYVGPPGAILGAKTIAGTELGNDYFLKRIIAEEAGSYSLERYTGGSKTTETHHYPDHVTSYVAKQRQAEGGEIHCLEYQIDPYMRSFSCSYSYCDSETLEAIWVKNGVESVSLLVEDRASGDRVDILFDHDGAITSIGVAGVYMLCDEGTMLEMLDLTAATQRRANCFAGEAIDNPFARSLAADMLGCSLIGGSSLSDLRVDKTALVEKLICNIDGVTSNKPHGLLSVSLD